MLAFGQAIEISILSGAAGYLITLTVSLLRAPKLLNDERLAEIKTRDEQIANLQRTVVAQNAESEVRFRFHLEANPSARTEIKMHYLDTLMMIGVSTVELVVTNGGQRPFNLLACRWFRENVPIHRAVTPHTPIRVNLTTEIITAIVGDDFNSVSSVPLTNTLPVTIDCQGEDGEPISTETKRFQIEIARASKALNVKIRKAE